MMAGPCNGDTDPPQRPQRGIGLDAEQVARFEKLAAGDKPWRHVYSAREAAHLAAQPQAARAFCAAFCCKEALCKALGGAYAFPEFECLYLPGAPEQEFVPAPGLKERQGIGEVRVKIDEQFLVDRGEFVVEVYLIRTAGSYLESLQVAAAEAERRRIETEHFSPGELAGFGSRRVQSLAGALALKRALAKLWAAAGVAAAPRDFELGHHVSGAPRLVAAPDGVRIADVFISISHTRQWAYGLAAAGR
jgi:phosphopantetheinyl transferase (holo-ACP synthase)